jgi:hypothetical protein
MTVIIILAGLVLSIAGLVQDKGARSRAEAEIVAIAAACESYKADFGIYPQKIGITDSLDPNVAFDPSQPPYQAKYKDASAYLYTTLSGTGTPATTQYLQFKPNMLDLAGGPAIVDPYGNYQYAHYYGYSTKHSNNPTFDLWSTANKQITNVSDQVKWIKNW